MSSSSPSIRANTSVAGYMMKMPPLVDKRAVAEQICQTCSGPIYSQGLETFQVPSKFEYDEFGSLYDSILFYYL